MWEEIRSRISDLPECCTMLLKPGGKAIKQAKG
jgi:hypothetical protein